MSLERLQVAARLSGLRMSGSLTISISGTPSRLRSTQLVRPRRMVVVEQLARVLLQVDPGDADPLLRARRTSMSMMPVLGRGASSYWEIW